MTIVFGYIVKNIVAKVLNAIPTFCGISVPAMLLKVLNAIPSFEGVWSREWGEVLFCIRIGMWSEVLNAIPTF